MRAILLIIGISSLGVYCIPSLTPPEEFLKINLFTLLRNHSSQFDNNSPNYLSITHNGRTFYQGETIDLGFGEPYRAIHRNLVFKNEGRFPISFNENNPPSLTSNSMGTLSFRPNSPLPPVWEPGAEFHVPLTAIPASEITNLWSMKIRIVSPEILEQDFHFRLQSTPIRLGRLYYSVISPLASRGILSREFNPSNHSLGAEVVHIPNPVIFQLVPTEYNRFMYYIRQTPLQIEGNYLDSSGIVQSIPPNIDTTLISHSVHGSDIPGRNRILSFGGGTSMVTTPYDPVSGILGSMSAVSGTQPISRWIRSTPNGDIIIQPDFNVGTNPGRFQVGRLENDGSVTNVYPAPHYYEDPILSNRLSIWWKHLTTDYLYFASHTAIPGANNLKVNSILRRRLNSDGTFSEVNGEYTIGEPGGYYVDVLKHPNDRWFYLMGGNGVGNRPIIHLYTMILESGIPVKVHTYNFHPFVSFARGRISPDGRYLGVIVRDNTLACPACIQTLKVFRIGEHGLLTEIFSSTENREFGEVNWLAYP